VLRIEGGGRGAIAEIAGDYVSARAREPRRKRLAQAARRAGYDGDFPCQHGLSPRKCAMKRAYIFELRNPSGAATVGAEEAS
jgi:hypothetical protein